MRGFLVKGKMQGLVTQGRGIVNGATGEGWIGGGIVVGGTMARRVTTINSKYLERRERGQAELRGDPRSVTFEGEVLECWRVGAEGTLLRNEGVSPSEVVAYEKLRLVQAIEYSSGRVGIPWR
jgi:hypothetical protein